MLSHSPLNTASSPGPIRLPIHSQLQQNNSRNQMHSPSPQMQYGNYGMPPINNFNNQMPLVGMRGMGLNEGEDEFMKKVNYEAKVGGGQGFRGIAPPTR